MTIDPQTGLPVDEQGNLIDASAAGSDVITEQPGALSSQASTPEYHPAAEIPLPSEQPMQAVSASYKGISEPQLKTVSKLHTSADKRADADLKRFEPQFEELNRGAERIAGQQRYALQLETQAHKEHSQRELELWKAQQMFQQEQAELEKHAFAQSQIVRQQYLAGYEQDLMTARVLAMKSGDPNESMGPGMAFGLIAQHAAAGFLKVNGVNIDVVGQTERFINREIAKHGQKVADAREAAQGQLHLYNLARQKSSDEYEARQRYGGMVLEGLKAQMQMEAARFNSQLASATAAQRVAEIDAHLLGIKEGLASKQQKLFLDTEGMRIQQAHFMAQDSIASETLKLARDKAAAEAKKKEALIIKIPDPGATIRDADGKVTGLKMGWKIKEGAPDSVQGKLAEAGEQYSQVISAVSRLEALRPPAMDSLIEKYGPFRARGSEELRAYEREKTLAIMGVRHAIAGAQLTPQEKAEWDGLLANDSGWESGTNHSALAQLEKKFGDDFRAKMSANGFVEPLAPAEQEERPVVGFANDTDAKYNTELAAKPASTSPVQGAVTETVKVGHNEVRQGGFSPLFSRYMKQSGDSAGAGRTGNRESEAGQRAEIDGVDYLASIIAKPDIAVETSTVNGKPTLSPAMAQAEAHRVLQQLASGAEQGGRKPDPEVQRYAAFVIKEIGQAPDAESFYSQVAGRVHPVVGTIKEQLEGDDDIRAMKARKTEERADFLRKGITGE